MKKDIKDTNTNILSNELIKRLINSKKEENGWTSILFDYYTNLKSEDKDDFVSVIETLRIGIPERIFDFNELTKILNKYEIGYARLDYSEVTIKNILMGEKISGYNLVKFYTPTNNISRVRREFYNR